MEVNIEGLAKHDINSLGNTLVFVMLDDFHPFFQDDRMEQDELHQFQKNLEKEVREPS